MTKIKVLVLPSDKSGVGKFRSVEPHTFLQAKYPDDFHIDIDYAPKIDDMNYWKNYQIVHFHRSIGQDYEKAAELIDKLNSMGIITIADIDDYWVPTKEHPSHQLIKHHEIDKKIVRNLKKAQHVTTTTEVFAREIRKTNKSVFILPNAIDPNEAQFKEPTLASDKLRFGWLGGSSHLHDLELLKGTANRLTPLRNKFEMYLCGFDLRGTVTEIDKKTKQQKQRPIKPEETVWSRYEEIVTDNYKLVNEEYKQYLLDFNKEPYNNGSDLFYHRVWTLPVTSYAKNYAKFDVSLAPLKDHIFNRMKSQLKVIEAGFYKKALIASNIGPYTIDLKHALQNGKFTNGNALLVDKTRNHSDWAKNIKKLIENPNWAFDLGERLYETVSKRYDLNIVTDTRAQIYKSLIK